jgi:hypothetical protein
MAEQTSSEKPRDIGQLVPSNGGNASSSAFKIDSELDSVQTSMIDKLQVPRDELRFIKELGSGDFYDLSLMEMCSGLMCKLHVPLLTGFMGRSDLILARTLVQQEPNKWWR